jgi:hypothetical protein
MINKNIVWLKKIKTTYFIKYWNDNILDQLISTWVNPVKSITQVMRPDNSIENKHKEIILYQILN